MTFRLQSADVRMGIPKKQNVMRGRILLLVQIVQVI